MTQAKQGLLLYRPYTYPVIRFAYRLFLEYSLIGKSPVVVYTMGKVGSTTVARSLEMIPDRFVFDVHFLTRLKFSKASRRMKDQSGRIRSSLFQAHYLSPRLQAHSKTDWQVITLVRDPIARNVSAFFQNLHWRRPQLYSRIVEGSVDVQSLCQTFLRDFPHDMPLEWFRREFESSTGVDVCSSPFVPGRHRAVCRKGSISVLVLRCEDLDRGGAEAMAEFLQVPQVRLADANRAGSKEYAQAYRHFKEAVRLPDSIIERAYNTGWVRHFYSRAEREAFARRWQYGPDANQGMAKI